MATNPASFSNRTALNSSNSALVCLDQQQICPACCIPQSTILHKKATIKIIYTKLSFTTPVLRVAWS